MSDPASYPIPAEYKKYINEILNKNFGIEVVASDSLPTFEVTVIVPDMYSNIPLEDRSDIKSDRRTKIITFAEGPVGVKAWILKVYNNFSTEIKAKITQDRITNL